MKRGCEEPVRMVDNVDLEEARLWLAERLSKPLAECPEAEIYQEWHRFLRECANGAHDA